MDSLIALFLDKSPLVLIVAMLLIIYMHSTFSSKESVSKELKSIHDTLKEVKDSLNRFTSLYIEKGFKE